MSGIRQNFKLQPNETFITSPLLKNLIKTTNIPKAVVEETTSELWYETLHGYGNITFNNNVTYEGSLRYGILDNEDPENPCTICFPDGTKYTGTIKNGEITGQGTYEFSNGSTYTGTVLNGLRDGKGTFNTKDNSIFYDGEWKEGLKHGKGKIKQDGMELDGEWVEGVLNGKCRIKWKTNNIFEGEIVDNKMKGNGYMIWYNKLEKYCGMWDDNLQNGFGIHIWYDTKQNNKFFRDRYIGEWKNGKREGYGKFFYSNGSIYEGYWKNNKKEGFGIFNYNDRTKYIGNFKNDVMIDKVTDDKQSNLFNNNNDMKSTIKSNANATKSSFVKNKNTPSIKKSPSSKSILDSKLNDTNNNVNDTRTLNVIQEGKSENTIIDNNNDNNNNNSEDEKLQKEKTDKINKNIDEIKIIINLSDIISSEPSVKKSLKEIDNILLRNLSLITHLYMIACGKEDIKSAELGISSRSLASDGKSFFKQNLNLKKDSDISKLSKMKIDEQNQQIPFNEEKTEKIIELDNVYNNDLYFCLDLKTLWKFFRECGLITPQFSLAMLDRLYFEDTENYIEMFYLPELLAKNNKNREQFDKIYDYIYQKIQTSKNIFDTKNKSKIDQSNILIYGKVQNNTPNNELYQPKEKIKDDLNFHDEKNVVLLRYFHELIIRVAYLRFSDDPNISIEDRLKALLEVFKNYFKGKRKSSVDMTINASIIIDPKLRSFNNILELFINNHYTMLYNTFNELYIYSCSKEKNYKSYDITITHKYFYNNIILNSDNLSQLFEDKMNYIDLITVYFKNKKIGLGAPECSEEEIFFYLEDVFNYEMIFREFCELIFYISRKYFVFFGINSEEEDCKGRILTSEEIEMKKEAEKRNKKKKKKSKRDNVDIYMYILNDIEKAKNNFIKKNKYTGVMEYTYPVLKSHLTIERYQEEERQRKIEEERQAKDRERYMVERNALKEEDFNAHKDEEEEEKSDSENLSDM